MFRFLVLLTICVGTVSAQDDAEYSAWMKATPPQINAIKAAIMAKDNAKVATQAGKLADTFQHVADFWMKRKKDDAVMMAQATRDAALQVASASTEDTQNAAVMKVQGTCAACHRAYREGSAGSYKIKE